MKKYLKVFVILIITIFLCGFMNVKAEEVNTDLINDNITNNDIEETIDNSNELDLNEQEKTPLDILDEKENNNDENTNSSEPNNNQESTPIEIHKVAVITTKVDEEGNPLAGATLQIIDKDGNVVDEWISDGTAHESLLPEGDYILHEVSAPEGYVKAEDKSFTVKVEINDMDAGVDWSEEPCEHYGGTPLYYVESDSKKNEVYCINQDWETPDDNSKYDGSVVTTDNIRDYTSQTTYVDAAGNKEKRDVSDQELSSQELYDKLLDIIYHRQKASDLFKDLSEAEIRYITESALKNYTNAGLTRVQRVNKKSDIPEGAMDIYFDGKYYWYLYTHFRSFVYDPDASLGTDIYKTVVGEGDAFGTLARHWNGSGSVYGKPGHNAKNKSEVREKIARYYELYQYLISNKDHHPSDMHLYIYSSKNTPVDTSGNDFDGAYQNLLGITWFNPYDENYKVELKCVNTEKPKPTKKNEIVPPITGIESNKDNSIYLCLIPLLLGIAVLTKKERLN